MPEDTLYKGIFSNQNMNNLIQGEIRVYAANPKAAMRKILKMLALTHFYIFVEECKENDSLIKDKADSTNVVPLRKA